MSKIALTLVLSILLFPILAGAENARIRITLCEVDADPEIETQIRVSWGARSPQLAASNPQSFTFHNRASRSTGTVEHLTPTMQVNMQVNSFIVYGLIRNRNGDIIRVIPAKLFDIGNVSLTQLEARITPRRDFNAAFLDSYPLEFRRDQGFLKSENVWPTLRSLQHMTDYAREIQANLSPEVWHRFHTFFQVNSDFFKNGSSDEISEVLQYLKTYTEGSSREGVALFYAEFLDGLVATVKGRQVFGNVDFTEYLHGQLMQLYETRLSECFGRAETSLRKFHQIGEFGKCLTLAEKILKSLQDQYLLNAIDRDLSTLSGILLQTTISGQDYFQANSNIPGANRLHRDAGAIFLAQSSVGRPTISEYLRVCKEMQLKGVLSLGSTGRAGEIAKFYVAYNCALQGGS